MKLVIRDENSGCNDAVLTVLGNVAQQSCAVHLDRNVGKPAVKINRAEFQSQLSEIFKQNSLRAARSQLNNALSHWADSEPDATMYLQANVDRPLVFYQVAHGPRRTHIKATNIVERFFRKLKRFEKSRQSRFADKRSCDRYDYNDRHRRMPHVS